MDFDPDDPAHLADPYPRLAALRARGPVTFSRSLKKWVVLGHADVVELCKRPELTNHILEPELRRQPWILRTLARRLIGRYLGALSEMILFREGVDHRRIRTLTTKAFTPDAVRAMQSRIAAIADEHVGAMVRRGRADFIEAFAFPFPAQVIAELLGIPITDQGRFRAWSNEITALLTQARPSVGTALRGDRAMASLLAYVAGLVERRRHDDGGTDVLSLLVRAKDDLGKLSDPELLAAAVLFLVAGHETTTNLLGNAVVQLLAHPEELERLRADPGLLDGAVDEVLRFDSSVPAIERYVEKDLTWGGVHFAAGDSVILMLAAANRDGEVFPEPDVFRVDRKDGKSVSFGHGAHFCIGAALARLELKLGLAALLAQTRRFAIPEGTALRYRKALYHRGLVSLPLVFEA